MTRPRESAGYFRSGLPYNRFGKGTRDIVIFEGLEFENRPLSRSSARFMLGMYRFLESDYTAWFVGRRPNLPIGYTLRDMADDYATTIREEFGGPVDVVGTSTGGSIALHFAADHPDLVRRLVIHSSAHSLSGPAKEAQLAIARLAEGRRWREASALMLGFIVPAGPFGRVLVWLGSALMALSAPKDPSDLVVTIEAEDKLAFRDRLGEIAAPTLVVAGAKDRFYTEALFRETAAGIPSARLVLYEEMGHAATGRRFERDVLAFLREGV